MVPEDAQDALAALGDGLLPPRPAVNTVSSVWPETLPAVHAEEQRPAAEGVAPGGEEAGRVRRDALLAAQRLGAAAGGHRGEGLLEELIGQVGAHGERARGARASRSRGRPSSARSGSSAASVPLWRSSE